MHRSLLLLSKLRLYGGWRRFKRTLSSPKGLVLVVVLLGFVVLVLAANFLPIRDARPASEVNWMVHPAALLGIFVLTLAGGHVKSPIAFSLAEVEFLFPGPFTRRQIVVHKLMASAFGTLGFAAMMPLVASRYLSVWWPAALVGLWWAAMFMQWAIIFLALGNDWLGARYPHFARALLPATVATAAVSFWHSGLFSVDSSTAERLTALESSWIAQAILAPFTVFSRLISAATAWQFLGWAGAGLAVLLCVGAAILQLDGSFFEASLRASQRRYDILRRAARSGGIPSIGTRSKPRFGLPRFPRLWGAGPIAWRQLLQLMRGSGRLLFIVPALVGPFMVFMTTQRTDGPPAVAIVVSTTLIIGFFISTIMPLGLRTDLDHVDWIKALPIPATAIVCGSIASAIVYTTLVQVLALAAQGIIVGGWSLAAWVTMAFAVPANLLLIASDSVLVLLFPSIRRATPGDLLVGMRLMLLNLAKMLLVGAAALSAALAVFAAQLIWKDSLAAMAVAGWVVLAGEGLATIWLAATLFARFDPGAQAVEAD